MDFAADINKNKSKLVKATNCNDALLDTFLEKSILHDSEVSDLQAKSSDYTRSSYLWDRIKQKSVTKETLIKIFTEHNQAASNVLISIQPTNSGEQDGEKFKHERNSSSSAGESSQQRRSTEKLMQLPDNIKPNRMTSKDAKLEPNSSKTEEKSTSGPSSKLASLATTDIVKCDDANLLSDHDLDFMINKNPFKVQVVRPIEEIGYSDDYYKLFRDHKGYALVINITKFEDSSRNRKDAEQDTVYLVSLFRQLGFTVDYTNVNDMFYEKDITQKVTKMKEKFQRDISAKCLAVFLGSHGIDRKILLSDGKLIDPHTEFAYKFIFNDLEDNGKREIAKLFFLSGCDLTPLPSRSTKDGTVQPNVQDAMFSLSTSPGYPSISDKYLGTHYVNFLTKIFMKYSHRYDLETMLKLMEDTFRKIKKTDKEIQIPIHYGVSMKTLYFNLPKK